MNIDIRQNIKNNFKEEDTKGIINSINESIKNGDELILPGLGVLFETAWKNCDDNKKKELASIIKTNLDK